jgi:hypothetical protein
MAENKRKVCPKCGGVLVYGIKNGGIIISWNVDKHFANVLCCTNERCSYDEPFAEMPVQVPTKQTAKAGQHNPEPI